LRRDDFEPRWYGSKVEPSRPVTGQTESACAKGLVEIVRVEVKTSRSRVKVDLTQLEPKSGVESGVEFVLK